MLQNPVVDVALIVAITAFFKKQLGLSGWKCLLAAFLVSLVISVAPIVAGMFPDLSPWLLAFVNVISLFLAGAGSFDFVMEVRTRAK